MESTGQPRQNFKSVCALRKATVVLYLVYGLHIQLILFGGALVDPSTSTIEPNLEMVADAGRWATKLAPGVWTKEALQQPS